MSDGMKQPWQVRWHVAPDGTVIRQRSKGEQPHQQLYDRFETVRRPEVSELEALGDRVVRHGRSFDRATRVLLYVAVVAGVALVAGLVSMWLGVAGSGWVALTGAGLLVVVQILVGVAHRSMRRRWEQMWTDAGLRSSGPVTIAAGEARAIVESPGTVSGRPRAGEVA